jgi:hypothetical protein
MINDYKAALQFVDDYFQMNYTSQITGLLIKNGVRAKLIQSKAIIKPTKNTNKLILLV